MRLRSLSLIVLAGLAGSAGACASAPGSGTGAGGPIGPSAGAATPQVTAVAELHLEAILARHLRIAPQDPLDRAHVSSARRDVERYFEGEDNPDDRPRPQAIPMPWP